jgi:hypothetical protein
LTKDIALACFSNMRSILLTFGAMLIILMFPVLLTSIQDARTDEYTQNFVGVSTAANVTAANVTLAIDVWEDTVSSVSSINSSTGTESPTADAYNSATRLLTIGGLDANSSRNMTVLYLHQASTVSDLQTTEYLFTVVIWFAVLVVLGLLVAALFHAFQGARRE